MSNEASFFKSTGLRFLDRGPFGLSLQQEECLGMAGPSGEGKSLFLRCLADLFPHTGELLLEGKACDSMEAPQWRRRVGLLPADNAWWFDTAGEHFSEAPSDLEALALHPGLLNQPLHQLSSGERQRLALLRLLQHQPRVLLLDEPTANLDEENTLRVEQAIRVYRHTRGAAVLWVSHNLQQLRRCSDRHLLLHRDGFREEGTV